MGDPNLTPKITSVTDTPPKPFMKGGNDACVVQVTIVSTAVDAGNTGQTHVLRAGLSVGMITASKKYVEYDDDGTDDGRRVAKGFLVHTVSTKDSQGTAMDVMGLVAIGGQPLVDETAVYGLDANGKTDLAGKFLFSTDYGA